MRLIRKVLPVNNVRPRAIAIGAFDGVHKGHQALISALERISVEEHLISALMTFEPIPKEVLSSKKLPRLTNFRERYRQIESLSIREYYCFNFRDVMKITHESFLKDVLLDKLNASYLFVGSDFRFGRDGKGSTAYLKEMTEKYHFHLVEVDTLLSIDKKISSTNIRVALGHNDLTLAKRYLGRPYSMSGRIRKGQQLGRTLGYPTANVAVKRLNCALDGVYLVRANLDGINYNGIASIGARPTLGNFPVELEVYLLDFSGDIYGRYIDVDFLEFISPQKKCDGLDQLVAKMNDDEKMARALISKYGL
jgi:riboflavin kinase/FMN adenylyltransferase